MPIIWLDNSRDGTGRSGYFVAIDGEVVIGPFPTHQEAWEREHGARLGPSKRQRTVDGNPCE
jgi:hypothetical protein